MRRLFPVLLEAAVVMIIAFSLSLASSEDGSDLKISEYEGMPCLWQNGLPCFGRFAETDRRLKDLSGAWSFKTDPQDDGEERGYNLADFDEGSWETTAVPGVWNAAGGRHPDYQGAAWYRLRFRAPGVQDGNLARLYFDGVCYHAKVWLNGEYLGSHSGGYTAWSLDATRALALDGNNVIAVMVDNRRDYTDVPPKLWVNEKLGWWPYGGIARLARLEISPRTNINKLVIEAVPLPGSRGEIQVSGLVYNYGDKDEKVSVRAVIPGQGKRERVGLGTAEILVPAGDCARFDLPPKAVDDVTAWSPQSPALYPLEVEVANSEGRPDRVKELFGFRKFEIRGEGVFLNGKPYWMRGMNRHEDAPRTGLYQSRELLETDMRFLKELHVNHMRPAHYPNDPRWLDLCDREGITIMEEIPLYQAGSGVLKWVEAKVQKRRKGVPWTVGGGYPTLRQMNDPELLKNASQQLIEMIERDRNHPGVIMWSVGNENFTFLRRARKMYQELIALSRRFDPGRPVSYALLSSPYGITPALEQTGDMGDVIMLNEYFGWYFGKAEQLGEFLDRVHRRYPGKPIIVSEFGAGTVYGRHTDPPEKFSEEYQVYFYETQFRQILERPYVVGTMPWVFSDFRCPWFLEEHPVYQVNLKGLVDYERNKKAAFSTVGDIYEEIERRQDK